MKNAKVKISFQKAIGVARRFLALIEPCIEKAEIAGSLRRQCKHVSEIVIVCVENRENELSNLFHKDYPGMIVNGKKLKRFEYPKDSIQIELHIVAASDYGRMLAIRTGSSAFMHIKLSITWNRLGFCSTEHGLRRKKECEKKGKKWVVKAEYIGKETKPVAFKTEYDFFNFLGIEYTLPNERNWTSVRGELNY
jgi:DNA polymerase/3'-5' exonuclease PolX